MNHIINVRSKKMDVIRTTTLCKTYGTKYAVEQLNLVVPKGAVYGFIGRNGAGKSTTQKLVCGLAKPTSGEIQLFEKPVDDPESRRKIGVLIENAGIYPGLSAHENMMLHGLCIGVGDLKNKVLEKLALVGLSDTGKKKTKQFSMGMKQRLGIGMALLGEPELLILDEPINGLDPEGIREFRHIIAHLNGELKMTVFISSHILGELSKIATHYGIIKEGKMVQQISAEDLSKNCPDYLCVKVNDAHNAADLLKQLLSFENCEVHSDNELHIYGIVDSGAVTQSLVSNGYAIQSIFVKQLYLEEYFLDFMGGANNA
jgi:ABC-2 type transport system ATP-binding protein